MEKMRDNTFYVDKWQVSPREGKLVCLNEVVRLEPRAMEVLVYLASRPDEVVTREELEQHVWRGALVGYDAVTNTIIKLRKALQDNARDPHIIATIPKKGYQLIAPIRQQDMQVTAGTETESEQTAANSAHQYTGRRRMVFTIIAMFCLGMVLLWQMVFSTSTTINSVDARPLPSIVVLPFENLSRDPRHDYLSDGLTEDIITDLSGLSNILVIASNTSSAYKGQPYISQQIGKELDVQYLLKGSVRVLGDTFRVNTQLVNAVSGVNVWAERYDKKITEVFDVQDELTRRIVESLTVKLTDRERSRLSKRATNSLKAYDLFQEGQRMQMHRTQDAFEQARKFYQQAIELDANYGRAYGAMAITLTHDYQRGWTESQQETIDRALVLARQGVETDNASPQTHWALSFIHMVRKEHQQAERVIGETVEAFPNYADGHALLGLIKVNSGYPEETIKLIKKAMRLNPFYSWQYLYTLGVAYYRQGKYTEAIRVLEDAQQRNENAFHIKVYLAASYVNVNREQDASWLLDELITINQTANIAYIDHTFPVTDPVLKESLLADLRRAGFPE